METRGRRKISWTKAQEEYLRNHYPTYSLVDMAGVLNMSEGTIKRKADEMGLKKQAGWTTQQYYGRYTRNYTHTR